MEVLGPASKSRISITLIGCLVFVLLANLGSIWLLRHFGEDLIARKWNILLGMHSPVDWLILGDSSGNQGVVPEILNKRLGVSSINLATHAGMGALDDAWMLGEYIRKFGPPRSVLIVHSYDSWPLSGNPSTWAKVPFEWGYWDHVDPALHPDPGQIGLMFLDRYVPLYSRAKSIADILKPPLKSRSEGNRWQKDGFMVASEPYIGFVLYNFQEEQKIVRTHKFRMAPLNVEALQRVRSLAEEYGFDVFIANGPLFEGLVADKEFQKYFSHVVSYLDDFVSHSARLHYISRSPMAFAVDQMQSVDHLIYPAARMYTDNLVTEIIALQHRDK